MLKSVTYYMNGPIDAFSFRVSSNEEVYEKQMKKFYT